MEFVLGFFDLRLCRYSVTVMSYGFPRILRLGFDYVHWVVIIRMLVVCVCGSWCFLGIGDLDLRYKRR